MPMYETDTFRIVRPTVPGGDFHVVAKDTDTVIAVLHYIHNNPPLRRWRVRSVHAPDKAPWTYGISMMEVARHGYNTRTA